MSTVPPPVYDPTKYEPERSRVEVPEWESGYVPRAQPELPQLGGSQAADKALRALGVVSGSEKASLQPREAIIDKVLVEKSKTVVAGEDKDCKSEFIIVSGLSLATGLPLGGIPEFAVRDGRRHNVLLIQRENDDRTQDSRMAKALAAYGLSEQPENLFTPPKTAAAGLNFSLPNVRDGYASSQSRKLIERAIDSAEIDWLLLDPFYGMIGGVDFASAVSGGKEILAWLSDLPCGVIVSAMSKPGARTPHNIYGDSIWAYWLEGYIGVKRSEVPGHTIEDDSETWNDLKVNAWAERDGLFKTTHDLRLKGHGRWEIRQSEAETLKVERKQLVRDHMAAYPEASLQDRVDALNIPKTSVSRYVHEIEKETT